MTHPTAPDTAPSSQATTSKAALRVVRSLSTLWGLGLQPGTYAEHMAARRVDEETGLPALVAALRGLVKANEEWNRAAESVIGRPPSWNDSYLDAARAALALVGGADEPKEK